MSNPDKVPTRNDSMLNTGMSSALTRRLEAEKEKKKTDTQTAAAKVIPGVEFIAKAVEEEKKKITNIEHLIINVSSEENVRAQLMALQMHLDWLNGLSQRYGILVRAKAKADAKAAQEAKANEQ